MHSIKTAGVNIFSAVVSNRHTLNVFLDDKTLCAINTEDDFTDVDVSVTDGVVHLWMSAASGSVYLITDEEINKHVDRFHKKNVCPSTEDDIFSDLLDDSSGIDIPLFETSEPVIQILDKHRVHQHSCGILSLLAAYNTIFFTFIELNRIVVHGYSESSFKVLSHEPKSPSFLFTHIDSYNRACTDMNTKVNFSVPNLFLITCGIIYSSDGTCHCSNKTMLISDDLFRLLFGKECQVINSPVLFLISPSFIVNFVPLKSLNSQYAEKEMKESFSTLCSLSSNITSLNAVLVENGIEQQTSLFEDKEDVTPKKVTESLLICGYDGKCVLFTDVSAGQMKNLVKYIILDGPVVFAFSKADKLFYTTGKKIFSLHFVASTVRENQLCTEPSVQISTTKKAFILGRIEKFLLLENGKFLCKKFCGQISCYDARRLSNGNTAQSSTSHDLSSQIKDSLLCMDRTHDETQQFTFMKEKCHFILNQLNIAAHVLTETNSINKLFTCKFSVIQPCINIEQCSLCLSCNITNSSGVSLPSNWFLHISIYDSNNQTNLKSDFAAKQKLLKFDRGFSVGCTEKIVLPLSSHVHIGGSVMVDVSLMLDINEDLEKVSKTIRDDSLICFDRLRGIVIKIPVHEKTLDAIDTLQPYMFERAQHRLPDFRDHIEEVAVSKPAYGTVQNIPDESKSAPAENRKLELFISLDVMRRITTDGDRGSLDHAVAVLKKLLSGNSLINPSDITRQCDLLTIDGRKIQITVNVDSQGMIMEMSSNSVSVLAMVKQCFQRRLKELGQHQNQEKVVKTTEVQRSLKKLNEVKLSLDTLQQTLECRRIFSKSDINSLVHCYERLRSLSLFHS